MTRTEWPWVTDAIFGRILVIASAIHAGSNAIAFIALYLMTRGNGDVKPDSSAIEAVFFIWQGLAAPLAWTVQASIDASWRQMPSLGVQIVLRLINSLVVGIVVAWAWVSIGRHRIKRTAH